MDFERVNIKGGSAYENVAGYSRIVKAGPFVYVSGTTSVTPEGTVYGEGDPYEQAKYIFNKLVGLLEENGVSREEVVKVNISLPTTTRSPVLIPSTSRKADPAAHGSVLRN